MPILVKDYTWKQTDEKIIVRVPLKGVDPSKADIFTCDNFIKVHCPPLLFEVCLRDVINEENSICRVVRGEIIFELEKKEEGSWDVLEAPLTKSEIVAVKQRAIALSQEKNKTRREVMIAKKQEIKNRAVRDQVSLESKERNRIDALREHEKKVAMDELEGWKQKQVTQSKNEIAAKYKKITNCANKEIFDPPPQNEEEDSDSETSSEEEIQSVKPENRPPPFAVPVKKVEPCKEIFDEPQDIKNIRRGKEPLNKNNKSETPLPRNPGRIGVTFTPRAFPTPSRESKHEEENEWLQKQAEARRRAGFVVEDLRPEEHDPDWLKDKGDSFYNVNNYIGAISAYTHGIKLNPKIPALYSNRAAAHLAMGNWRRVIQDTTKALELLVPCVEMNASSRSLCHARRGTALCQLNVLKPGLADLQEALKLCPDNKKLEKDIRIIEDKIENPDYTSEEDNENDKEIDIE